MACCLLASCDDSMVAQAEHQTSDIMPEPQHTGLTPAQPSALDPVHTDAVLDAKPVPAEVQAKEPSSKGPLLKHINFWHEDELKMAHPEVQASFTLWLAPH